jgi:hypothetical protein
MGYDLTMLDGTKYLVEDWQRLRSGDPLLPADICDLARSLGDVRPYHHFDDTEYSAPRYFRTNVHGMGQIRDRMEIHGMLDTSGERPEAPGPEGNGWGDRYYGLATYRHKGMTGVPWWKLCSNDYWIVTPGECIQALRKWIASDRAHVESGHELWNRWLGYLAIGAVAAGFDVG